MNYRIAYLGETMVNWCPQLGTVLANDEVVDGVSERGGFPVVQKKMRQWCLRVSAYAQRLLDGLDTVDWTDSLKETQRNWIGRSEGTEVQFKVKDSDIEFTIFTTRADTMFGVTFMVLAPESELVPQLTTEAQKAEVEAYLDRTKKRTERERIADRRVTGVFSGSYAINPFTGEAVPVWISDYVLAGYGTGAIMAVPAHDSRDYAFAKHFNLPIVPLVEGCDVSEESFDAKEGIVCNSPRKDVTPYCVNQVSLKRQLAEEGVRAQRADFLPQVAAIGGGSFYNYQVAGLVPRWAVGVGVNIKIFDGLNREYKYSAAKQTVRRVGALQNKAGKDISVLVEKLYNQMMNYRNQMTSIDASLAFAEEYLRMKNAAFLEGMSSSTDLIDAELNLAGVRTERLQAAYNFDLLLAQLLEAAGISDEFSAYARRADARPILFDKK